MKQILLYVPVIHAGYERLIEKHADAQELLLVGDGFAAIYPQLAKEIRALAPRNVAAYLRSRFRPMHIRVIEPDDLPGAIHAETVVVPDEALMRQIVDQFRVSDHRDVAFERTFLRWDRSWSLEPRPAGYDGVTTNDEVSRRFIHLGLLESCRTSDWWRSVGAVAVRDDQVLAIAHNTHVPSEYSPYIDGDPRNEFHRGVRSDLSTAIHAEALVIATAARVGRPLVGADLYVTAFPCPACARLIASSGFRRCYFTGSYATLEGDTVLRNGGVELILVDLAVGV